MTNHAEYSRPVHCNRRQVRRYTAIGVGIAAVVCLFVWRDPLRQAVFARAVLANDSPTDEAVQELIDRSSDPGAIILAEWNTGKIVPRALAVRKLSEMVRPGQAIPAKLRDILLAGALDPDLDVREIALSTLDELKDPALAALSAAQLKDLDPEVRLLGLKHIGKARASVGVPAVVPLLKDSNPQILARAVKALEDWSSGEFGVRMADAVPVQDTNSGLTVFDGDSYRKTRAGADRAAAWWDKHRSEFPEAPLQVPVEAFAALRPVSSGDFTLPLLGGKTARLSDFRGKVVVLNFWATWCTACLSELPELIALQNQRDDELAILGVTMDFVPDEDNPTAPSPPDVLREKIARTVRLRGINYPVWVDEKNELGGRFNGGELPTTIIIDAHGRIRRRFVGARTLPAFRAMIAEASQPVAPMQTATESPRPTTRN